MTDPVATDPDVTMPRWYRWCADRCRGSMTRDVEPPAPVDVERDDGVLRRRSPEQQVGAEGRLETDVPSLGLGQEPLLLEHVAVGLDGVAARSDDGPEGRHDRLEDLLEPTVRGVRRVERRTTLPFEPRLVLMEVVQQQASLALERDEPGQPRELASVEPPSRHGDAQGDRFARLCRRQADLVDREAEVVEAPDPCPDRLPVAGRHRPDVVQLRPQSSVALADALRGFDRILEGVLAALHGAEVGETEADVLDQDVEVVGALAVRQGRVDLARLGVDEIRLDLVAVETEQRIGERAVAPV